jgi:hypothetical protein
MERLILCSKALYDNDVSQKMKEISALKDEIKKMKKPTKFYESWEEFENAKVDAFSIIRESVDEMVSDNHYEWSYMETFGITPGQNANIPYSISRALETLTGNAAWADTAAFDIVWPALECFVDGLMENEKRLWNILYSHSSSEEIGDLFFNVIKRYIDDHLLLDDVFTFKCVKCHKVVDYVEENDRCIDCENIV